MLSVLRLIKELLAGFSSFYSFTTVFELTVLNLQGFPFWLIFCIVQFSRFLYRFLKLLCRLRQLIYIITSFSLCQGVLLLFYVLHKYQALIHPKQVIITNLSGSNACSL